MAQHTAAGPIPVYLTKQRIGPEPRRSLKLRPGGARKACERLPRDRIVLQIRLDSATPDRHDLHHGSGTWARALSCNCAQHSFRAGSSRVATWDATSPGRLAQRVRRKHQGDGGRSGHQPRRYRQRHRSALVAFRPRHPQGLFGPDWKDVSTLLSARCCARVFAPEDIVKVDGGNSCCVCRPSYSGRGGGNPDLARR